MIGVSPEALSVVVVFNALTLGVMLFALIRHEWVIQVRDNALAESRRRFLRMASYGEMLRRFWVWDSHKFDGAAR